VFRRRNKPSVLRRIGNLFWPEIGLLRWLRYVGHRVGRLPGTAYTVAAGLACGAAISMTPFVGFHFVLSALVAWLLGANIVAALIGTVVGNPWTFPLIWAGTYKVGNWLLGRHYAAGDPDSIHFASIFGGLLRESLAFNLSYVIDVFGSLLWPMVVGSIPTAILTWLIFYFPLRRLVAAYKHQRIVRRQRRRERRARLVEREAVE